MTFSNPARPRARRGLAVTGTLAAVLALLPAALGTASASAADTPHSPDAASPGAASQGIPASAADHGLAATLERKLGDRTTGSYLDPETGKLTVNVTDEATAAEVREAGAEPRHVQRDAAQLAAATRTLEQRAAVPGTSWGVDPMTNRVEVHADSTVPDRELNRLEKVVAGLDGAARVTRVKGTFTPEVVGGDAIYGGGYRCSAAFNVSSGGTRYFLTAGHCTNAGADWSDTSGGPAIGVREGSSFPTNDYGIVRYTDGSQPGGHVNLYNGGFQDITGAADPVVGQAITKSGSTTEITTGSVTATGVTVNYGDGDIVYDMVRTNACSAGGDSGGAHFEGSTALGIHSGGTGVCDNGVGGAIFQPVTAALQAYGVDVY